MTTTTPPSALLDQLLVDTCVLLDHAPDSQAALAELVYDHESPVTRQVAIALQSKARLQGQSDYLAQRISAVAAAASDVERGHRSECTCCHDETRWGIACTWSLGCDRCDAHWQQLLDDAVRELHLLLGDLAIADLSKVVAVGRQVPA